MEDYYDFGDFYMIIIIRSYDIQIWFNWGFVWCYGFNYEEVVKCFEWVVLIDFDCVMIYWGFVYVLGFNYNKLWVVFDDEEGS